MSSIRRFPRLLVVTIAAMLLGLTLASTANAVESLPEPTDTIEPEGPSFIDVPETHSFYEHIETIASWGIVKGYADGTFRPNTAVTRGQLAVMAYNYLDGYFNLDETFEPPAESPFVDLPTTHTFYKHVTWLNDTDVVKGYADGTVRPNTKLSRGQLAAIMFNLFEELGYPGVEGYEPPAESPFSDVHEEYTFYQHIAWLEEEGIVNGYGDGTFRPDAALTRGQIAVIMVKVDRLLFSES